MIPVAEVFLLCSIPSLTVGILIYGENPKHAINRLLLLFSVVLFYWGFTQFEYMNANDIQTTLLWMRLHSFWYLLPALALDFAIVYTNLRVRRLFRCLFVYCPAIFLSVFENVAISYHPTMMPWGWDYAYSGYFGYVELLWTILPTVLTLYILARKYLSAKSQNERIGLGYIFSGFSLPIIMGITTTVLQVLASIDLPDLTAPSAAVGFLLVWYGVVRHGSYILMANAAADDILSTMADALFLVNRTGEVVVSNKAASRLLGYDSSELFGRQLSTLTSEPVHLEALLGDSSTIFESYLKTKQGQIIPVSLSKSQILTKTGDLMGYVIICHDITVRKQSEKTLRESEDRYRRLFESSPVSLWEEDFSDVKKYLDELRERGVSDFRTHFIEHPEDVSKCSELVKIISVNQATLTLYKAKSVSEFLGGLNKFFTKESLDNFREEIVSLAEGKTRFENKFFNQTLAGDMKQISLIVTVVPGYEDTLGKVLVSVIDLTEHKLMEDSLRDSERRFRELTDMLPETVLEQDLNGNYTFMNPAGLKHSGYDKDDLKRGLNAFQLVAPEDHDALREGMRRILNGAPSKGQELTIVRKDGSRFPEIAYATPIVREGKPVGLRCVVVDITERKRMEEKLRSVGERLEYVIQSNPAVIYVGKPFPDLSDSYSTFQSKNTVSITGFESDEFVGEKGAAFWASRVHPDDLASYRAGTADFWRKGHRVCEYRFLHKDGAYRWIMEEANVIRDSTGSVRDIIGYWIDVTERKRMEEELRSTRKRMEYVLASNPAVLYIETPLPDLSNVFSTFVSESTRFVLGFQAKEFLGESGVKFWRSRVHPDDLDRYLAEIPSLWRDGYHAFEFRFLHSDGTYRWIREEQKVTRDAGGRILDVVGVGVDITERKKLEEKLATADRLAVIGQTAAMVAHDLRNPLQGITTAVYLLKRNELTSDQKNELLRLIESSVEYAEAVTRDLMDYSREIHLALAESQPREIVQSALQTVKIPSNIMVQDMSQEQPTISVDSDRMKRVLINLIQNAIDAMPQGGTLTIQTTELDGNMEIKVSDTGTGMPKKIMENLWKPMQTTKTKGMGLGLPIAKRIIEAHGGDVSVETTHGKGTTFTIRLPVKELGD